jgi:sporulation protein YlmC with PRC-barrel domain
MQTTERKIYSSLLGKMIVTKEGKRLGFVKDITFETRSGELINLILKEPTPYTRNLNLEKTPLSDFLVPFTSIIAIGDFVVISEEDLI